MMVLMVPYKLLSGRIVVLRLGIFTRVYRVILEESVVRNQLPRVHRDPNINVIKTEMNLVIYQLVTVSGMLIVGINLSIAGSCTRGV
jgi:hypothetical protein